MKLIVSVLILISLLVVSCSPAPKELYPIRNTGLILGMFEMNILDLGGGLPSNIKNKITLHIREKNNGRVHMVDVEKGYYFLKDVAPGYYTLFKAEFRTSKVISIIDLYENINVLPYQINFFPRVTVRHQLRNTGHDIKGIHDKLFYQHYDYWGVKEYIYNTFQSQPEGKYRLNF